MSFDAESHEQVRAADGHVYNRKAIEQWLKTHDTSPMTNKKLPNKILVPVENERDTSACLQKMTSNFKDSTNIFAPPITESIYRRAEKIERQLSGFKAGHDPRKAKHKPKQKKKNFKQQKRHQNIKNAKINKQFRSNPVDWQTAMCTTISIVEEWAYICRSLSNDMQRDSRDFETNHMENYSVKTCIDTHEHQSSNSGLTLQNTELLAVRRLVDKLFSVIQHVMQSGPLQHSRPALFKRCNPGASTAAACWFFLKRILLCCGSHFKSMVSTCSLDHISSNSDKGMGISNLASIDATTAFFVETQQVRIAEAAPASEEHVENGNEYNEIQDTESIHTSSRFLQWQFIFFTKRQVDAFSKWIYQLAKYVQKQIEISQQQGGHFDTDWSEATKIESRKSCAEMDENIRKYRSYYHDLFRRKENLGNPSKCQEDICHVSVATGRCHEIRDNETMLPLKSSSMFEGTPQGIHSKVADKSAISHPSCLSTNTKCVTVPSKDRDRMPRAGGIARGGHGEEWHRTDPKSRMGNNKLLRSKREQAALIMRLQKLPTRLMSGKKKKEKLIAKRAAKRDSSSYS